MPHLVDVRRRILTGIGRYMLDVLSTSEGFKKRYGLVYVNKDENGGDLRRYKKDSYYWYQKVIQSNGSDLT